MKRVVLGLFIGWGWVSAASLSYTGSDIENWQQTQSLPQYMYDMAYGNGVVVDMPAIQPDRTPYPDMKYQLSHYYYSTNKGQSWREVKFNKHDRYNYPFYWESVRFLGDKFYLIGYCGAQENNRQCHAFARTTDGKNLQFGPSGYGKGIELKDARIFDVTKDKNGRLIATGDYGILYSDNDGDKWNWSSNRPSGANYWRSVDYSPDSDTVVTVNAWGCYEQNNAHGIAYSEDGGESWISVDSFPKGCWNSVRYLNGQFIAVGTNRVAYSTDGKEWHEAVVPYNVGAYQDVAYGDGKYVVTSHSDKNGNKRVITSIDGHTWKEITASGLGKDEREALVYADGVFIAHGSGKVAVTKLGDYPDYIETEENAGSVSSTSPLSISLSGEIFADPDGDGYLSEDQVNITNLPEGLIPRLKLNSDRSAAMLTFDGKAQHHQKSDDVAKLHFVFDTSAFESGNLPQKSDYSPNTGIRFENNPDHDGDGIIDSDDPDDDNDGILDTVEDGFVGQKRFLPSAQNTTTTGHYGKLSVPRLNDAKYWAASYANRDSKNNHLLMTLPYETEVVDIMVQGSSNNNQRVTRFLLEGSRDGKNWTDLGTYNYTKNDPKQIQTFSVPNTQKWSKIRVTPKKWINWQSMRFAIVGLGTESDVDNDGIPNRLDLDSDNDGLSDALEASWNGTSQNDPENDGIIGSGDFVDSDADGLSDVADSDSGGAALVNPDTDVDGIPDYLDSDSDGDGLPDTYEGNFLIQDGDNDGIVGTGAPKDSDKDGLADSNDPDNGFDAANNGGFNKDRDNDGIPNYLDTDIDGDGIPDNTEGQPTNADGTITIPKANADVNRNGLDDAYDVRAGGTAIGYVNTDGGSAPDYADDDSDNDGKPDSTEGTTDNAWRIVSADDHDNDGVPDDQDVDDDNDGILDTVEGNTTDLDGDGIPNSFDLDSDGDGIPDAYEMFGQDPDKDGHPGDGEYNATRVDANGLPAILQGKPVDVDGNNDDVDGDGKPNYLDLDSDGDTISDVIEGGGTDADGDGQYGPGKANDADADGLADAVDPLNDIQANGFTAGTPLPTPNTDADPAEDFLDKDHSAKPPVLTIRDGADNVVDAAERSNGVPIEVALPDDARAGDLLKVKVDGHDLPSVTLTQQNIDDHTVTLNAPENTLPQNGPFEAIGTLTDALGNISPEAKDSSLVDTSALPPKKLTILDGGDEHISKTERDAGTDIEIELPSDAKAGDILKLKVNGSALPDHTLTDTEITDKKATVRAQTAVIPQSGQMKATGTITDALGNVSPEISDTSMVDTVAKAPTKVTIKDGGDETINQSEREAGVDIEVELPDDAGIGDKVSVWLDGQLLETVSLEASHIASHKLFVAASTEKISDTDGAVIKAEASIEDILGNISPKATDTSTIDLSVSNPIVKIDDGGDGVVNKQEREQGIEITYVLPKGIQAGDVLHIYYADKPVEDHTVTSTEADAHKVVQRYNKNDIPTSGTLKAEATITNAQGNTGDKASDTTTIDIVMEPTTVDRLEPNDDGTLNAYGKADPNSTVTVTFPDGSSVTVQADAQGNYGPAVSNTPQLAGNVTAIAHDDFGNESNTATSPYQPLDSDGDGIPDTIDPDDDNDGIPDTIENTASFELDADHDGIPNRLDLDSDNDGLSDALEASWNGTRQNDPENDGIIGSGSFADTDRDGLSDVVDGDDGGSALAVPDTDGDGIADFVDLDSDGDGLPDTYEGNFLVPDGDNDGIVGTGIPIDTDHDGLADSNDPDSGFDAAGNGGFNQDRDGDGKPNYLDIDIDNDGIVDNIEGQPSAKYLVPSGNDINHNGLDDAYDVSVGGTAIGYVNTDGGSAPDYADIDADNDGIPDINNTEGVSGSQVAFDPVTHLPLNTDDVDGDGLIDVFDNVVDQYDPSNQMTPEKYGKWRQSEDFDHDGIPDTVDIDDDNDGILDVDENKARDVNGDAMVTAEDADRDSDGFVNSLDLDSDGDGIPDNIESGDTTDTDGDGHPGSSYSPTDVDAQGLPKILNGQPIDVTSSAPFNDDVDGDGIPNFLDLDSDGDRISDVIEGGGVDENHDDLYGPGKANDDNANGLADAVDPAVGGAKLALPDADDGDGTPDYLDPYEKPTPQPDTAQEKPGKPVTIDVLRNDGNADPHTVRLLDAEGNPVMELVVDNEGVWSVDPDSGRITFTPEKGFTGDPTPIHYQVKDRHGNLLPSALVTIDYQQKLNPNIAEGDRGETIQLNVANDDIGIDRSSVSFIVPENGMGYNKQGNPAQDGERVVKVVVDGEGTWEVDDDGMVTFTPDPEFDGEKVIIAYTANDPQGKALAAANIVLNYTASYGTLTGYVWNDSNANGTFDKNEKPIEGVEVMLLDTEGKPLAYRLQKSVQIRIDTRFGASITTRTDAEGYYALQAQPGKYRLRFTLPKGTDTNWVFLEPEGKKVELKEGALTVEVEILAGKTLTLDAQTTCACSGITNDKIPAVSWLGLLGMFAGVLLLVSGLLRKEEPAA